MKKYTEIRGEAVIGKAHLASGEVITCVKEKGRYFRTVDWIGAFLSSEVDEPVIEFEEATIKVVPTADLFAVLRCEKLYSDLGGQDELLEGVLPEVSFQLNAVDIMEYYRQALWQHQSYEDIFGVTMTLWNMYDSQPLSPESDLAEPLDDDESDEDEAEEPKREERPDELEECFRCIRRMGRHLDDYSDEIDDVYRILVDNVHHLLARVTDTMAAKGLIPMGLTEAEKKLDEAYSNKAFTDIERESELGRLESFCADNLCEQALTKIGLKYLSGKSGYPQDYASAQKCFEMCTYFNRGDANYFLAQIISKRLDDEPELFVQELMNLFFSVIFSDIFSGAGLADLCAFLGRTRSSSEIDSLIRVLEDVLARIFRKKSYDSAMGLITSLREIVLLYVKSAEIEKAFDMFRIHNLLAPETIDEERMRESLLFVKHKKEAELAARGEIAEVDQTWLFDLLYRPEINGRAGAHTAVTSHGDCIRITFQLKDDDKSDFIIVPVGEDPAFYSKRLTLEFSGYESTLVDRSGELLEFAKLENGYYLEFKDGQCLVGFRLIPDSNSRIVVVKDEE